MSIDLKVNIGEEFIQMYFALIAQREAVLCDAIKSLSPHPTDIDCFVEQMQIMAVVDSFLIDLVTGLNQKAEELQNEQRKATDLDHDKVSEGLQSTQEKKWKDLAAGVAQTFDFASKLPQSHD